MTHIDTAEMYGDGRRPWSARRSPGGATRSSSSPRSSRSNASRRGTVAACERSLARLRTDRLDCYLLHWRGRTRWRTPSPPSSSSAREGKILLLGREQLRRARPRRGPGESRARAGSPATRCSTTWSERAIEHAVLPWCEAARRRRGRLQPVRPRQLPRPAHAGRPRACEEIAARARRDPAPGGAALPGAAPRRSFTIPKASSPEHAAENAGAGDLRLTEAELARIDEAFPRGPRPRQLPML